MLMREQLKEVYNGEPFTVAGSDNNAIDCFYIHLPGTDGGGGGACRTSDSSAHSRRRARGTVLYCPPNGGLYETMALEPKDEKLGHYTALGFEVCLFNYRGFCRSDGVPDPDRVKRDGVSVANHLRRERGVTNLIVHGVSMGGMVASHVGNPNPNLTPT